MPCLGKAYCTECGTENLSDGPFVFIPHCIALQCPKHKIMCLGCLIKEIDKKRMRDCPVLPQRAKSKKRRINDGDENH